MVGDKKHLDSFHLDSFAGRKACEQVHKFNILWPTGIDVASHQSSPSTERTVDFDIMLKAAETARDIGLDLTFAACSMAIPEHLGPFIMFTLQQRLRLLGVDSYALVPQIMADEPKNSPRFMLAASILRDAGAQPTGLVAYGAAIAARKGALAVKGKVAFREALDEQGNFWVGWIRKARDGELLLTISERLL